MPFTMTAFAIGSLSMIGLPPTAGICSKWWLVKGAAGMEHWAVLAVLLVSTLLNAAYFLPILWRAFFRPTPAGTRDKIQEAPWPCVVALSATAVLTVLLFFFPELLFDLAGAVR